MAFKMKGFSGFKQKSKTKKIPGQDTGNVGTSKDGKDYSIASESNITGVN